MTHRKKFCGTKDGGRAMTLPLSMRTLSPHGEQHTRHRKPPSEHWKYRTATPQINLLSTRLSLPKWRQFKGEVGGWTKDTMMKLQWRPCHTWDLLSLTSLCHSGYELQGICIWPDTFSDGTSLKSFLLHQHQTSVLLFCMTFFQRQGFYYLNLTQLASFMPVHCIYADIFRYTSLSFPPAQAILENSKSMSLENTQLASHQLFKEDFYYYY